MSRTQAKTRVIVRSYAPDGRAPRRRFPWTFLLILLVLGGVAGALFGWEQSQAAAIYPGVRIAGVNVGGMSLAEARRRLAPLRSAALDRAITVVAGPQEWKVTPQQLGLRINLDQRLQQAYALGREPDLVDRYSTQADLALHGRRLSLIGNYDGEMLQAFVRKLAIATFQPAQPATVRLQAARATLADDARDGRRLDQQTATSLLATALADPHQSRVTVPIITVPAPVSEAEGRREVAALDSILTARLHLHFSGHNWLLGSGVIAPAISLTTVVASGGTATYQHSVDQGVIARFVDGLGAQIDRPMRSATVVIHGAAVSVTSAQSGYHLDRTATVQVLMQAILQGGEQDVTLPVGVTPPTAPTEVAQQTAHRAAELIRYPLALTFSGRQWLLDPTQLASLLTFTPRRDPLTGPQLDIHVDPARLPSLLGPITAGVAIAPVNARFVVHGNRVQLVPSSSGRRVDVAALAQLIEHRDRAMAVPVPVQTYEPQLSTTRAQALGIKDLILSHSTYFPGSSVARLTNIHAAVQHLDGQLIAPGEVFSFNKRIGPITTAGGYVQGINIIDNQDVPGIGGGVCQVAVTLFQTAVFSGLPIVERTPHANIVSYYNPIGMDATVYVSPDGPDVKFLNNTGHWVLISFAEDLKHYRLTAQFFGTDPHFRVVVRGPYVKNQPNGDVDAVFYRTVYDPTGRVLLDAHFNSHYVPVGSSE